MKLDRRTVLKGLVAGAVTASVRGNAQESTGADGSAKAYADALIKWDHHSRVWDGHTHLGGLPGNTPEARMEVLVRHMDRMGIERLILSEGYLEFIGKNPTPRQVRLENDRIMRAVRHFPDRAYGSLYVNPNNGDSALQEFDRCVRDGPMVAVGELEVDVRCNSPKLDPIVERAISMNVPILQHTWIKTTGNMPGESTPSDLVELAARHPRAQFICGHTGGNWELGIRWIRTTKNIWAGIAGSDPTSGFVEMAVRELGAERVIYGSDTGGRCFAAQLAKVLGAEIPDSAKKLILGENLRGLLQPVLKAKGLAS